MTFSDTTSIIIRAVVRSWRNRQTRTFEGRMGDRMGSSPIDRTNKIRRFYTTDFCMPLFYAGGRIPNMTNDATPIKEKHDFPLMRQMILRAYISSAYFSRIS